MDIFEIMYENVLMRIYQDIQMNIDIYYYLQDICEYNNKHEQLNIVKRCTYMHVNILYRLDFDSKKVYHTYIYLSIIIYY